MTVGTYENDIYEKNHVVLEINKQGTIGLPASGFICLDYRKDKINVERQLDALNVLEKEDYQCSFNLKRIISGVEPPSVNVISKPIHMFNEKLDFPQRTAIKKSIRCRFYSNYSRASRNRKNECYYRNYFTNTESKQKESRC